MAAAPLVIITGPTASGKTALAIKLASKFNGEIICADSRTVYKGMDIGTAKPSVEEQAQVQHWGLDLVDPDEHYTAADFQKYAMQKIDEIRARGHIPFLVGGTGLYIDAVLFNYDFGQAADAKLRSKLEKYTVEELHTYCNNNNIPLPENNKNKRYIIRAIEQGTINNRRQITPLSNSIIVGIATDKEMLRINIEHRSEQLFADGVVNEAKKLGNKYGWNSEAMTGNIYPLVRAYLVNEMSLEEAKAKFVILDWRLAKRQLTWLRRNTFIKWLSVQEADDYLSTELAAWRKS